MKSTLLEEKMTLPEAIKTPCKLQEKVIFRTTFNLGTCKQPSQNVPAAGYLAVYNKISAAYFTLVRLKDSANF